MYLGLFPTDIWQKPSQYYTYPPVKINKSVQFSSVAQSCPTHCDPMDCSTPGLPVHHMSLPKPKSIESLMPSSHLIPFSSCLQSFPKSGSFQMSQLFTSGGQNVGSFRFSISPSNEHPGMISFRMDWLDLLAGQVTLKSLLQHHSSKASIIQHSAFFVVQLSHPYMTTKNYSLD